MCIHSSHLRLYKALRLKDGIFSFFQGPASIEVGVTKCWKMMLLFFHQYEVVNINWPDNSFALLICLTGLATQGVVWMFSCVFHITNMMTKLCIVLVLSNLQTAYQYNLLT